MTAFVFEVHDLIEQKKNPLLLPGRALRPPRLHRSALALRPKSMLYRKGDDEIAAVTSTQRLFLMAGRYVGKDDPVMIVRGQSGMPAVGEILEPFAFPHTVAGWMRGSHHGPIMPVSFAKDHPSRFDGPPRVVAYGFQLAGGELVGPRDMFDDPSYDNARQRALDVADYLRQHGPFEPQGCRSRRWSTRPARGLREARLEICGCGVVIDSCKSGGISLE